METSPLICRANERTGFYMIETSVMNELTFHTTFQGWCLKKLNLILIDLAAR